MSGSNSLAAEAEALLDVVADRLRKMTSEMTSGRPPAAPATNPAEPAAASSPTDPAADAATPGGAGGEEFRCTGCPLCAARSYWHEHPELPNRLVEGALGLVTTLRQHLQTSTGATSTPSNKSADVFHNQSVDVSDGPRASQSDIPHRIRID
jgi:hypothetical protein